MKKHLDFKKKKKKGTSATNINAKELQVSDRIRSVAQSCPTLWDPMNGSMSGLPVHHHSWSSLRLTSIESVMPTSHLILCHPLLLLPPIPPSIRVFSNESTLRMKWPKYWSFSFSIIPSKEHPGLISFCYQMLIIFLPLLKPSVRKRCLQISCSATTLWTVSISGSWAVCVYIF